MTIPLVALAPSLAAIEWPLPSLAAVTIPLVALAPSLAAIEGPPPSPAPP